MDEKTINTILIAVVYPAMILIAGWIFALLVGRSGKTSGHSSKRFDHRIRK